MTQAEIKSTISSDDHVLSVEGLKTYFHTAGEPVKAVDDINFSIRPGETFCVVGESGSGKSITSLSTMGLVPMPPGYHPGGGIMFKSPLYQEGQEVNLLQLSDSEKRNIRGGRIGMIFQEPMTALNPVFTIGDQIMEALLLHTDMNSNQAKQRAVDLLEMVQMPEPEQRLKEYPHKLSGGQRQRVMIAMAMACEPDLLIADEPTTALDVTIQAEILRLMKELQERKGTSILFITHDIAVVSEIADRVAVMCKGKIVEVGDVDQVIHNPQHDYTKSLINALPEKLKDAKPTPKTTMAEIEASRQKNPILTTCNLKVHFPVRRGILQRTVGHVKAVDGVDLTVGEGEILALVGESGCGKTTLGRAILQLIRPTEGEVYLYNQELTSLGQTALRDYRRDMQIIFQDPFSSLNPRLTIADALTEPMKVHGVGDDKSERLDIAGEMLKRVHLDPDMLYRYPHEFSGGQRQRIGVARCLVLKPKFIVCDEVTSALDVSVQASILRMLLELRDDFGLTYLFITHDISVVEYLADETAVMYKGKIVERGPTAKVCTQPEHEYTQKLLGAVPRIKW